MSQILVEHVAGDVAGLAISPRADRLLKIVMSFFYGQPCIFIGRDDLLLIFEEKVDKLFWESHVEALKVRVPLKNWCT